MVVLHIDDIPNPIYKRIQSIAMARGLTLNRHIIHLIEADIAANEARENFKVLMSELKQRPYAPPSPNSPSTADLLHELRDERNSEL
ncbi:MAG: hypothetical protein KIH69_023945 [Anaerolineae bacterium]|nr:hypothetical protein [Anaerolineae bacterium]